MQKTIHFWLYLMRFPVLFSSTAPRVFAIALGATLVALILPQRGALGALNRLFYDVGFTSRASRPPSDIVILGIDERFMQGRHAYLAPRDRLAKLLDNCVAGGARAIALDVWLDSRLDFGRGGVDWQLQQALKKAKNAGVTVVLSSVSRDEKRAMTAGNGQNAHGDVLPFFSDFARVGDVSFFPDADGAVRWFSPCDGHSLPFQIQMGGSQSVGEETLNIRAPLAFCGPPGTVERQSATDFLQPEIAPLLAGKTVFIGATYRRSFDFQPTPYSFRGAREMYGVEILAQASESSARFDPKWAAKIALFERWQWVLALAIAWFCAALASRGTARGGLAMFFAMVGASAASVLAARGDFGGVMQMQGSVFGLSAVLAGGAALAHRGALQARELALVRDTFGAYVGAQVLESLGGKMPELGGENRHIAVLFCDIRGYSALAESISDPRALLDELNAHFEPLVAALQTRGAYVDNYVGDLVMALFGAPVSQQNFALDVRAGVLAALDFVRLIEERNAKRRENGQIPIEVGIGLHCGEAVVGNMGSRDAKRGGKIHYTALGDVVNVASRIEGATRAQKVPFLVTREVLAALDQLDVALTTDLPKWMSCGEIPVKGRAAPVEIYAIDAGSGEWKC